MAEVCLDGLGKLIVCHAIQLSLWYEESLYLRTQFVHHSREGWKIGYQPPKRILPSLFHIVHYTLVEEILGASKIDVPQPALVMEVDTEVDQVQAVPVMPEDPQRS